MVRRNDNPDAPRRGQGQLFFGGLTAGDTEGANLPPALEELLGTAGELLFEYRARNLEPEQLAEAFSRLVAVDAAGDEWTVGCSTLAWYRRSPGLPWMRVQRPDPGLSVAVPAPKRGALTGAPAADVAFDLPAPEPAPADLVDDPLAGAGPWGQLPVSDAPAAPAAPVGGDGPWSSRTLAAAAPSAPTTVPLSGPFAALPPNPPYADGPLTGVDLDVDVDDADAPSAAPGQS